MKKIIIIGATSGIGQATAEEFLKNGYQVGGCGRNEAPLKEMKQKWGARFHYQIVDIKQTEVLHEKMDQIVNRMDSVDMVLVASSISKRNPSLEWQKEKDVLQTNIMGYSRVLLYFFAYFKKQGSGHIAGITSIAKLFGNPNPAYNASKAFEAVYLDGWRSLLKPYNIHVTEIIPGFVDTPLIRNRQNTFWLVPVRKAATQIRRGLIKKKRKLYISKRWYFVYCLIRLIPDRIIESLIRKNAD
ncbi:MAG: SDR family NAD(P)-dependent oxidoreductase [Caldithrix sp.]|nr:SDR family NAD(P)-dependent oxidoreductase [Caldithrix sp.]